MSIPEKHRAVAHAWVDGAAIEWRDATKSGAWTEIADPNWYPNVEYRVKPKPKVKKWRWVVHYSGRVEISTGYLSEEEIGRDGLLTPVQKIYSTMIEVEE